MEGQSLEKSSQGQKKQLGIGLIKTEFYKEGKMVKWSTGTGFLIQPDIVLTCAHNLLNLSEHQMQNRITFYLPTSKKKQQKQKKQEKQLKVNTADKDNRYFSNKTHPYKYSDNIKKTDQQQFIKKDFAIVKLAQKVTTHSIIKLDAKEFDKNVHENKKVKIQGFPIKKDNENDTEKGLYKLETAKGKLKSSNCDHINYEISSSPGNSGSPVSLSSDASVKSPASSSSDAPLGIHIIYNKFMEERTAIALNQANINTILEWIIQINEKDESQIDNVLKSCKIRLKSKKKIPIENYVIENEKRSKIDQLIEEIQKEQQPKKEQEQKKGKEQLKNKKPKQDAVDNHEMDEFSRRYISNQWPKTSDLKKKNVNPDELKSSQRKYLANVILNKSKATKDQNRRSFTQNYLTMEHLTNKLYSSIAGENQLEASKRKDVSDLIQQFSKKLNKILDQNSKKKSKVSPENVFKQKQMSFVFEKQQFSPKSSHQRDTQRQ